MAGAPFPWCRAEDGDTAAACCILSDYSLHYSVAKNDTSLRLLGQNKGKRLCFATILGLPHMDLASQLVTLSHTPHSEGGMLEHMVSLSCAHVIHLTRSLCSDSLPDTSATAKSLPRTSGTPGVSPSTRVAGRGSRSLGSS